MNTAAQQVGTDEFIELLKQREQDAEASAKLWKKRFKLLAWFLVLFSFLGWHWIECVVAPTYLTPEEFETKVIYLHKRHWFGPETVERLEARRADYGAWEWMTKSPDGAWWPAFEWRDE